MLGTLLWQNLFNVEDAGPELIAPSFVGVSSPLHSDGGPMTSPTFVGASTFIQAQSGTSFTPTIPTPSSGDIVIMMCHTTFNPSGGFTAPLSQGWQLATSVVNNTTPTCRFQLYWKRWGSGATDDTTPTFTFSGLGTEMRGLVASVWRGCVASGSPFDDIQTQTGNNTTTVTAPSATSSGNARTVVRFYMAALTQSLSGFSGGQINAYSGASYGGGSESGEAAVACSYLTGFSAGATGTGTVGGATAVDNGVWIGLTAVLEPPTTTDTLTPTVHASTTDNDIVLASIWRVDTPNAAITPPSGYTLLTSQQITSGVDLRLDIYWHRFNSSTSDTTPTFTNGTTGSSPWSIGLTTWRNCNATEPFGSFGGQTGSGATLVSPSVNVAGPKRTDVRFYAAQNVTTLQVLGGQTAAYSGSSWGSSVGSVSRAGACTYAEDVSSAAAKTIGNGSANYAGITIILEPDAEEEITPLSIDDCVLWLQANRGVTLNGSNVSLWEDQSPSGFDVSQATADAQPLFEATSFNGLSAIQGGSGDILTNSGTLVASGDWTIIVCYDFVAQAGQVDYVYWNTNSESGLFVAGSVLGGKAGWFDGTNVIQVPNATVTAQGYVLTVIQSGNNITIRANGSTNSNTGAVTAQAIRNVEILNRNIAVFNFFANIELGGIAVYDRALTGDDLDTAEGYWSDLFGVTLS